jgi:hypothetical protein
MTKESVSEPERWIDLIEREEKKTKNISLNLDNCVVAEVEVESDGQITCGKAGWAFVMTEKGKQGGHAFLTAKHVVDSAKQPSDITLKFSGHVVKAHTVKYHPHVDLAVVIVPLLSGYKAKKFYRMGLFTRASYADDLIKHYLVSGPTTVVQVDATMAGKHNGSTEQGYSGSPIYSVTDVSGTEVVRLVGIHTHGGDNGTNGFAPLTDAVVSAWPFLRSALDASGSGIQLASN